VGGFTSLPLPAAGIEFAASRVLAVAATAGEVVHGSVINGALTHACEMTCTTCAIGTPAANGTPFADNGKDYKNVQMEFTRLESFEI
jgi:hypothetical protein